MPRQIDLALRLPDSKKWLKPLLVRMAQEAGVSLNVLMISVLETWAMREGHKRRLRSRDKKD